MVNKDEFWNKDRSEFNFGEAPKNYPPQDITQEINEDLREDFEQQQVQQDMFYGEKSELQSWDLQEPAPEDQKMDLRQAQQKKDNTTYSADSADDYQLKRRPVVRKCYRYLSPNRKVCFTMLFIFVACWCFYLGFNGSSVFAAREWDGVYVSGEDLQLESELTDLGEDGIKTILLVGCDKRSDGSMKNDSGRTDTIMLAFVNANNESVSLLSIPRDTYVTIPSSGAKTKINHAYAYGGIPLTESTIENFLGIKIDNYAQIDFQGFADVVDALGGVTIDVEMDMYTPWEGIDLKAGEQLLDGENALAYVRYREKLYGDVGRVDRQQKFIKVLADDVFSSKNILKLPGIVDAIMDNLQTDLTTAETLSLANFLRAVGVSNLETFKLPGQAVMINGISYWKVNESQLPEIVDYVTGGDKPAESTTGVTETTETKADV